MTNQDTPNAVPRVRAAVNGRQLTLDPIGEVTDLAVPARRVESLIPCGFQVGWAEFDTTFDDGTEVHVDINCGAGVGSMWLTLAVRDGDGAATNKNVYAYECVSLQDLAKAWLTRVESVGRTPEGARP